MEFISQTKPNDNGIYIMMFKTDDKYYYFKCNLFTSDCEKITFENAESIINKNK
jgi:hypothetical protein